MLEKAIDKFATKADFCRAINMTPQFLSQILDGDKPLPARFCIPIEKASQGAVTRYQLRPDIFGKKPEAA